MAAILLAGILTLSTQLTTILSIKNEISCDIKRPISGDVGELDFAEVYHWFQQEKNRETMLKIGKPQLFDLRK
jgi:hypothetical protein